MVKILHPAVDEALRVAVENATAILEARGMSRGAFGERAEKAGAISRKTIYNILKREKTTTLESLAPVADQLGIPLWALILPGLSEHKELLAPGALKGLSQVVDNYLRSDPSRRADIEETARVSARLSQSRK